MRITLYDFGRIVVDGETHGRDVIIHPDRVEGSWWRTEGHRLDVQDLERVWDSEPETLVVGTGYYGNMRIPRETLDFVRSRGIEVIAQPTPDAVETFNTLQTDSGRRVVAVLHLTWLTRVTVLAPTIDTLAADSLTAQGGPSASMPASSTRSRASRAYLRVWRMARRGSRLFILDLGTGEHPRAELGAQETRGIEVHLPSNEH